MIRDCKGTNFIAYVQEKQIFSCTYGKNIVILQSEKENKSDCFYFGRQHKQLLRAPIIFDKNSRWEHLTKH